MNLVLAGILRVLVVGVFCSATVLGVELGSHGGVLIQDRE
jgi:hypothetical protein